MDVVNGISNANSEAYIVDLTLKCDFATSTNRPVEFADKITAHLMYCELLSVSSVGAPLLLPDKTHQL